MIEQKVEAYIERWGGGIRRGGNETANLQMFLTELCTLLDLPQPEPARAERSDNAYIFERSVTELFANGGKTSRRIDRYGLHKAGPGKVHRLSLACYLYQRPLLSCS